MLGPIYLYLQIEPDELPDCSIPLQPLYYNHNQIKIATP